MLKTALCLALVIGATASPALARGAEPLTVQFEDLDIATQEGQAELDARIDRAVRDYCKADVWVDAQVFFQSQRCMKVAQARVKEQRQAAIAYAMKNRTVVNIVLRRSAPELGSTSSSIAR